MTALVAALAAFAVALLATPSLDPRRLQRVLARPQAPPPVDRAEWARLPLAVLAGVAVALLLGGTSGLLAAVPAALVAHRLLERPAPDDSEELARELPLALELLAACLAGGGSTDGAVRAVADASGGAVGGRLRSVSAALAVGCSTAEAWAHLGDSGPAGSAARALARSADGGAPVVAAVQRVAEDARRAAGARAEQRARRAGVLAVGPLGACFLPAFLLLGVVPAVVGLAGPLLASL